MNGSSPRGRGTRRTRCRCRSMPRVIPAWAGNTNPSVPSPGSMAGHPRVGGEHKSEGNFFSPTIGSSPRGRGTLLCLAHQCGVMRVIPAWAGNTLIATL